MDCSSFHSSFVRWAQKNDLTPHFNGYGINAQVRQYEARSAPYTYACWYTLMSGLFGNAGTDIYWSPFSNVYARHGGDSPTHDPNATQLGVNGVIQKNKEVFLPARVMGNKWKVNEEYLDRALVYAKHLISAWGFDDRIIVIDSEWSLPLIHIHITPDGKRTPGDIFRQEYLPVVTGLRLMNEAKGSLKAFFDMRDWGVPLDWALLLAPHFLTTDVDSNCRTEHHYSHYWPQAKCDLFGSKFRLKDAWCSIAERDPSKTFDSAMIEYMRSIGLPMTLNWISGDLGTAKSNKFLTKDRVEAWKRGEFDFSEQRGVDLSQEFRITIDRIYDTEQDSSEDEDEWNEDDDE